MQHPLHLYSYVDNNTEQVQKLYLTQNRDKYSGKITFALHVGTPSIFNSGQYKITAANRTEYWFFSNKPHPLLANTPHISPSSLTFLDQNRTLPDFPLYPFELTTSESHSFLSQIMPTVPLEIIPQWTLPFLLSACPEGPVPHQETLFRYSVSYAPKTLDPHTTDEIFLSSRNLSESPAQPLQSTPQLHADPAFTHAFLLKSVLSTLSTSWRSYYPSNYGTTRTYLPINGHPFPQSLKVLLQYDIPFHKTYLQYLPVVLTSKAPQPPYFNVVNLEKLLHQAKPHPTAPFPLQLNNLLQILSKMAQEIAYNAISC